MPYYEYHCGSNGQTLEVRHSMSEKIATWGELTQRAGAEPGDTPVDTPVERLISASVAVTSPGRDAGFQGCGTGCACAPQH